MLIQSAWWSFPRGNGCWDRANLKAWSSCFPHRHGKHLFLCLKHCCSDVAWNSSGSSLNYWWSLSFIPHAPRAWSKAYWCLELKKTKGQINRADSFFLPKLLDLSCPVNHQKHVWRSSLDPVIPVTEKEHSFILSVICQFHQNILLLLSTLLQIHWFGFQALDLTIIEKKL